MDKVDREKITSEDMIILILKAQTNHFHHMDQGFRGQFERIDIQFNQVQNQFREVHNQFKEVQNQFREQTRDMNQRFDQMNKFLMWQGGAIFALFSGIYLKLFFG